ncbi:2-hydroxychromene-2-carboxylate isomerase [Dankookia rubra]|uniref:2-hydroxychromene-2-carboxylate isomerase n=1 Tax=Dankookia rubra TaxID=1442381 RepID=A0A4R5QC80_9PROT|nr:DsbA family protein [Dankookia rubra]TDH60704.1 2-hydroxychromene-2-carboxylate isomerase [Dankookia rubra]
MAAPAIDVWFTMGSTYTFLTVSRIDAMARAAGVAIRLRPFRTVGPLTGATQLPFLPGTAKMHYMWRDIGRRVALHGLRASLPVPYPAPSPPRANRVALVGMAEGWGPDYVRAAYRLWFEQGIGTGGEENLRLALAECGQADGTERILALAESEAIVQELDRETGEARRLGLFGSPSFVVGGEVFWGDDHLEDAIRWARQGRL